MNNDILPMLPLVGIKARPANEPSTKEGGEVSDRRGGPGPRSPGDNSEEALFDRFYGEGAYRAMQETRLKVSGVRQLGGILQYSVAEVGKGAVARVQDCDTNIQVKARDIETMTMALAQAAKLKRWNRVELEGDPKVVAEIARRLKEYGIEVAAPRVVRMPGDEGQHRAARDRAGEARAAMAAAPGM